MSASVPSLSLTGWLTEISEKADKLMGYYITADYSQSNVFKGKVTSLPYHIRQYGGEKYKLSDAVRADLIVYLGSSGYFDNVEVDVRVVEVDPTDPAKLDLRIDVVLYDGEYKYSMGRLIQSMNGSINNIIDTLKG